ncbi:MAG: alpha/beta fold hydrolase [Chloroflexota bacterium]
MTSDAMSEATWKRRFRAPVVMFPTWAREKPDRLLYLSNAGGKFEVYAWDKATGDRRQVTDRAEGTGYRVSSRLDPRGEWIWWFDDEKGNELGRWVREPWEGGQPETIAPQLASAYSGRIAIHSGERADAGGFAVIGRSRSDEGSSVYVVRDGAQPRRIYAHEQSAFIEGLSRDGTLVALFHSEHGDSRNRVLRIIDLDGTRVAELSHGPGHGISPSSGWAPVAGDARYLAVHDREDLERPLILDARTGRSTEVRLDLPGEAFADWYPDARSLLIGHDHRGRTELYRYDLASATLERLATEPGTILTARVRPDGAVWYMLDRSSEAAAVREVGGGVVLTGGGAPEGVAYRDADVDGVHVFIAEPAGGHRGAGPNGGRPTFFFIHGGPEAADRDSFSPTVQAWVDHGFAVVCVNYRGSSGYGKAWRDAIVGRPGLTELEDIAKVHDWAVATKIADPRRSVLGGGSWGGYLTLLGLGTQPERWALGIGIVPIGDYIPAYEDEMEPLKKYDAALFGGTPTEVPERYRIANPITYIDRVRVPMLLLVGQNDPRCPSRSVDVYRDRLRALGKPFEEYRYDAGHGSLVVDERLKQVAMQIAFVAKHLGTAPPQE